MFIEKRSGSNGLSYRATIRYRGKRIRKTFVRRIEAEQWAFQMEARKAGGEINTVKRMRFGEFANLWINKWLNVNVTEATRLRYMESIDRYLAPCFRETWLDQIDAEAIEGFKAFCRKLSPDLSNATINRNLSVLRCILNTAVKWKYLSTHSATSDCFLKKAEVDFHYLSRAEVRRLLDVSRGSFQHPIYAIAIYMGLRKGEIFALKPGDFDLKRAFVTVKRGPIARLREKWWSTQKEKRSDSLGPTLKSTA